MQIAAIVVSHSRPDLLLEVVLGIKRQSLAPDRIVVIDNASPMPSALALQGIDGVSVVRSETNLGGSGGFALGMEWACSAGMDWIWLLDDDAVPHAHALSALAERLPFLAPPVGAVCGAVRESGQIAQMHRRHFSTRLGIERCLPLAQYAARAVAVDTASFVGFLVSAQAARVVGLPMADFFLAYDDTEYCLRLKAAGYAVWMIPASVVYHLRSPESRLRSAEFGVRHYFNVRNRIVVKRAYAHYARVSAWGGILFGVAMWMRCKGRFRHGAARVLLRALSDGYYARLGPYPADLHQFPDAARHARALGATGAD